MAGGGEGRKTCSLGLREWTWLTLQFRIRNKAKLRALELTDPRNTELRTMLQKAEFALMAGADVVNDDDDDHEGPASDSD